MADYRLFAGIAVLVLVFAGLQGGMFSTLFDTTNMVDDAPYFCPVQDDGDISFNSVSNDCTTDVRGYLPFDSGDSSTSFWVGIESVNDGSRESVAPVSKFLIEQGYVEDESEEYRNLRMTDLKWDSDIKSSLESGTACSARIKPDSRSEFTFNGEEYHEHWEGYKDTDDLFTSFAEVEAKEVKISDSGRLICKFNLGQVMEGSTGQVFESVSEAGQISIYGENEYEGVTGMTVDFGFDSDGDGVRDENDDFPDNPRLTDRRDSDGDGVFDEVDAAPNEAGSKVDGSPTLLEGIVHDLGLSGWLQPDFVPRF